MEKPLMPKATTIWLIDHTSLTSQQKAKECSMEKPLMPKATAIWLIDHTSLTFQQIAEFCQLHILEVQAMADGEIGEKMVGFNPIFNGQLTQEEIDRCTSDPNNRLQLAQHTRPQPLKRSQSARYTPLIKRADKPDAILWLLKKYPKLSEQQIIRLIGTTKMTIRAVRDRTHWNREHLKARDPVELGLCTKEELEEAISHEPSRSGRKKNESSS